MDPVTIKKADFAGKGKLWINEGGKYLYEIKRKEKFLREICAQWDTYHISIGGEGREE